MEGTHRSTEEDSIEESQKYNKLSKESRQNCEMSKGTEISILYFVEENSSSSILETKIQICLGPDSPWAKFALAQLLTDLKKIIRNEFQIKSFSN